MPGEVLRLFVFARHAESAANAAHVLSTDPSPSGMLRLAWTRRPCLPHPSLVTRLAGRASGHRPGHGSRGSGDDSSPGQQQGWRA